MPDRRWRPSVFCETSAFRGPLPLPCSLTRDMCVLVGTALTVVVATRLAAFALRTSGVEARSTHAPAPVSSDVFTPLRKSGMPAAVLTPAPVNAIICLLVRTYLARRFTLRRTSWGGWRWWLRGEHVGEWRECRWGSVQRVRFTAELLGCQWAASCSSHPAAPLGHARDGAESVVGTFGCIVELRRILAHCTRHLTRSHTRRQMGG
mmetsp:Transcript_48944/g.138216  ORF Transcript_48944/g.138216 Transcript_48944/m.138216 type:complete len:206 (-) Transcript_48944:63-680(-)